MPCPPAHPYSALAALPCPASVSVAPRPPDGFPRILSLFIPVVVFVAIPSFIFDMAVHHHIYVYICIYIYIYSCGRTVLATSTPATAVPCMPAHPYSALAALHCLASVSVAPIPPDGFHATIRWCRSAWAQGSGVYLFGPVHPVHPRLCSCPSVQAGAWVGDRLHM